MSEVLEAIDKTEWDEAIREATRRIVSVANPQTVLLFGSAARGEETADSDLDFLVVVKQPVQRRKLAQEIYRNLHGLPVSVDVVVVTSDDIEKYGDKVGTILPAARSEGKVVYESTR
jgi:predicted nucleotidyltransferase